MDEEQTYELIERYLAGELVGEELQSFESRLENNSELKAQVEMAQELDEVLADEKGMAFSQMLVEVETGYFNERESNAESGESENSDLGSHSAEVSTEEEAGTNGEATSGGRVRRFPTWMAVAASVVLLAVVGYFTLFQPSVNPADLYGDYYTVYAAPEAFRGDSSLVKRYEFAFLAYNAGNYEEAGTRFENILQDLPDDRMAIFYAGLSAQGAGMLEEAVPHLESLADGEWNAYQQASRWYLGLNYLKRDQLDSSRKWLELLKDGKGSYPKKARELLEKID